MRKHLYASVSIFEQLGDCKMKWIAFILLLVLALSLTGCFGVPRKWDEEFVHRDVKDDFCGVEYDARYCKCVYHGDFCDDLNMTKKQAKAKLDADFSAWVIQEKQNFIASCIARGGEIEYKTDICRLPNPDEPATT